MSKPNDNKLGAPAKVESPSVKGKIGQPRQPTQPQPQQGDAQACIEQAAKLIVKGNDPNGAILNLNEALAHVDALQVQRDELLAALHNAEKSIAYAVNALDAPEKSNMRETLAEARAAIANATK